jgi:hypothetical protein
VSTLGRGILACVLACVAGCGGKTGGTAEHEGGTADEEAGANDAESGAEASAGSSCPGSAPGDGDACTTVGASCQFDPCDACLCTSDGKWSCLAGSPACTSCPAVVVDGATCGESGLICDQHDFCGQRCVCSQGTWSCQGCGGGSCGGASCGWVSCPASKPEDGMECPADAGAECVYPWAATCTEAICSCGESGWSCKYVADTCGDGG